MPPKKRFKNEKYPTEKERLDAIKKTQQKYEASSTKVRLHSEVATRWRTVMTETGCKTHNQVAKLLLDWYVSYFIGQLLLLYYKGVVNN